MSAIDDAVKWEQKRIASRLDDILSHVPDRDLTQQLWWFVDGLRVAAKVRP